MPATRDHARVVHRASKMEIAVTKNLADWSPEMPLEVALVGDVAVYQPRGLKHGNRATPSELEKAFSSPDPADAARQILLEHFGRAGRQRPARDAL